MSYARHSITRDLTNDQATHYLIHEYDKPLTFAQAAAALGVPYHVIQRAARRGLVPTYRLGTSRPYVKLRDFIDLMARSANG
ncbi:MAG: hypothetical protein WA397_30315 [Roseiarcus sp.]